MDFRTFREQFEQGQDLDGLVETHIPRWARVGGRVFVAVFSVAWLGGVLSMLGMILPIVVENVSQGMTYRHVEAVVLPPRATGSDQARPDANERLTLAYVVDDRRYVQNDVEPPERLVDADWTIRAAPATLEPNATLPLWHDPDDPREFTLDPIPQPALAGIVAFFLPFVLIGLGGLAVAGLGFVRLIRLAVRFPSLAVALGPAFGAASGVWAVGAFLVAVAGYLVPWQAGWALAIGLVPLGLVAGAVKGWRVARQRRTRPGQGAAEGPSAARESIGSAPSASWQGAASSGAATAASTPVGPWKAKRSSAGGLVFFALFWNGMVSVFLSVVLWSFAASLDARWRYEQTDGNVVEAQVLSPPGGDGEEYRAQVVYRYTVGERSYTSDRIGASESWQADARGPRRFVRDHPPGTRVLVYYDPANPDEAILDPSVPPMMWFLLVFLQPFVCVGIGVVWGVIASARQDRARRRFFATPVESVDIVPGWGPVRRTLHEMEIVGRPDVSKVALAFAGGYAGVCFASIFVLLIASYVLGDASGTPMASGARIALGLGLAAGTVASLHVRSRRRRPDRLLVARDIRRVDVSTHDEADEVYFDDIAAWETRPGEHAGTSQWTTDDGEPQEPDCLLRLVLRDGRSILVHAFGPADAAVAQRLAANLSVVTDALCRLPNVSPDGVDWDDDAF